MRRPPAAQQLARLKPPTQTVVTSALGPHRHTYSHEHNPGTLRPHLTTPVVAAPLWGLALGPRPEASALTGLLWLAGRSPWAPAPQDSHGCGWQRAAQAVAQDVEVHKEVGQAARRG